MMEKLILGIEARSAEELTKHTAGPGTRYVFSDHNNNPDGNIYTILRVVENVDNPEHMKASSSSRGTIPISPVSRWRYCSETIGIDLSPPRQSGFLPGSITRTGL
jgi:hypothetical protein